MRIEARGVSAGYGRRAVLHDVTCSLAPGELLGIIGPNGSGKSTLLRVLSGYLRPTQGVVELDGRPVAGLPARERALHLAFVPQQEAALFEFSVREVVLMGRTPRIRARRRESEEDYAAARRAMAEADVLHLADRPITALSGGEHRRVLLARALAQDAPITLLDEPTAHLDLSHQAEILALLRRRADTGGALLAAALHDLNLAAEYCGRLLLLAHGRVAASGPPAEVLTPAALERAFGAAFRVAASPVSGAPLVSPCPPSAGIGSGRRVHVVCGGGSGAAVMALLHRHGAHVTAGPLNRLDADQETAAALGIEHAVEAPYSPIGPEALARARELALAADVVVVCQVPFGHGNVANLEMALELARAGRQVVVLGESELGDRDFTGGLAAALWGQLLESGARPVPSPEALASLVMHATVSSS